MSINYTIFLPFLSLILSTTTSLSSFNQRLPSSWSNRQGVTLTPITTGVWAAERTFLWNSIDVGGRSVILRTNDGNLLVHSPVEWTDTLGNCLKQIGGEVKSPNYEHLKYATQWHKQYPNAFMYGCPGLMAKLPEIKWKEEIENILPKELTGSLDHAYFDCEINPFTRKPFFNEICFFHLKSKSFLMADTFWNYPVSSHPIYFQTSNTMTGYQHNCPKVPTDPLDNGVLPAIPIQFGTRLWKFGMDKIYLPFYKILWWVRKEFDYKDMKN